MKAEGLEPSTYGLKVRSRDDASRVKSSTSDNPESVLASCLALLKTKFPDLALLVERWNALPDAVRAGIVAMVKASGEGTR